MFFSALESRVGEEIRDAEGKIICRRHALLARPPVQYRFEELHPAFSEYLDALVLLDEARDAHEVGHLEIVRAQVHLAVLPVVVDGALVVIEA